MFDWRGPAANYQQGIKEESEAYSEFSFQTQASNGAMQTTSFHPSSMTISSVRVLINLPFYYSGYRTLLRNICHTSDMFLDSNMYLLFLCVDTGSKVMVLPTRERQYQRESRISRSQPS